MAKVECLKGCGRYTEDHFLVSAGNFRDVCHRRYLDETIEAVDDAHIHETLCMLMDIPHGTNTKVVPPDNAGRAKIEINGVVMYPTEITVRSDQ